MSGDSHSRAAAGPDAAGASGRLVPALLLLFLGTIWGLNASVAKLAGQNGVAPIGLAAWQMSGAAVVTLIAARAAGLRVRFDRAHWRYYLVVGLIGTAAPNVNMVNALNHLPAGLLMIGLSTVPLFSYLMSLAVRLERFDRLRLGGVLLGFAGVLTIVLPEASLPEANDALWFLIGLLTPLLYGFSSVATAKLRPADASSLPLAAGMLLVIALALWPTAWAAGHVYAPGWPVGEGPERTAALALAGVIAVSSIAYILYFEIVRMAGPVAVSVVGYVVTCTGIGWGMVFFDERHSPYVWVGVAVIFAGLALVNKRQTRAAVING